MPAFNMQFKAQMEGIEKLVISTEERLNVACTNSVSGDTFPNLWLDQSEEVEIAGSRGTANLVVKVGDKQHGTVCVENFKKDFEYPAEKVGQWVTVCKLECRNIEPTKWIISGGEFTAFGGEGKTKFDTIAFEDGAWFDYDDNQRCEVNVQEVEGRFVRA
ncbi:UPF0587 protein C2D10.03c [Diplonema papillatum]|nr:UPF0587 protein C2D10.03c [Diplonema papillatum]